MIDIDITNALRSEGECGKFSYEGMPELQKDISIVKPLVLKAEYCVLNREISVKGSFDTTLIVQCDRCLAEMEMNISQQFDELFVPDSTQKEEEYTYHGKTLSLDKMVYDAIILSLPQQLLCKETCKGICVQCGQDLNDKECDCRQENTDEMNPFTKLKGLF